jgi:hypothetical protein
MMDERLVREGGGDLQLWLVVLVILLAVFAIASAAIVLRRGAPAPPDLSTPEVAVEEARRERRQAAEALGSELLDRRVALDARRGPLAGNAQLDGQVHELEQRLHAGEISMVEFEREKTRLLGG